MRNFKLIINFHNDRNVKMVLVRPQHPDVVKHLGDDANGKVLLFKRGESAPVWSSSCGTELMYFSFLKRFFQAVAVEPQAPAPTANVDMTQYQVQLVDLKSTISYMLFKYAPGTTPMRRFLYRLNEWIWTVGDSLAIEDWTKKVQEIQLALGNPIPEKVEWIACIGSKPNLRGYTCGLWTMAHAITVEAYKTEAKNPLFNPVNEVMEPFHQFIFHFLSCGECAQNFDNEAKRHKLLQVSTKEEMVMWFWRVHNFVNTRLSGARSDDPRFPKRQFPPSVVCPQCRAPSGFFDEKEIFKFLLNYYSDIRQDSVQGPPGYKLNEYKDGKLQSVGARHLNPKFAVHAKQVDKMEETEERLRKVWDASPQREWKDIEGYENLAYNGRSQFFFVWLSVIGVVIVLAYCKYRRNRSKFWKTFYYHSDYKL
ncbi:Erv1 / Alr family protein [Teladorsagia circumcincta]|uniref:Sulfhydryl oxidase n=1 Tax=Teladorsagia circumcincta TaxID=45464 RepID=A0A2G9UN19_TELCI|nr:Erv1 / Alr family protein [Teladorsagia circumcincta]